MECGESQAEKKISIGIKAYTGKEERSKINKPSFFHNYVEKEQIKVNQYYISCLVGWLYGCANISKSLKSTLKIGIIYSV